MKTFRLVLIVIFSFLLVGSVFGAARQTRQLNVHFLNVGQADSILIQTPNRQTVLIDAGTHDAGWSVVKYLLALKIKRIDVLIATHPHEDHIGGMPEIINSFTIGQVYMPKVGHNTRAFEDTLQAIQAKGLKINTAKAGLALRIDPALNTEFLGPNETEYEDLNDCSAVLKLTYGKTSFLFMGDAGKVAERQILQAGFNVKADVLKVGRHGSNAATTGEFLNIVTPAYAIISVGAHNDFGLPSKNMVARLKKMGVRYFRTDENGTVVIRSDGQKISFM